MGRKRNDADMEAEAAMMNGAAAAIGAQALRTVLTAGNGHGRPQGLSRTLRLAHMCRQAADHLSEAHKALFLEPEDADVALGHLDAALDCLKDVAAHSNAAPVFPRKSKSA